MEYTSRAIPQAIKRAVLARDGMVCQWCGGAVVRGGVHHRPDYLHFDHVRPWADGGDHTVDNLVVSCARCNLSRAKPRVNIRKAHAWVEFRHGRYWWPDGYSPPTLISPDRCAHALIEAAGALRLPVLAVVQMVHRGVLPATGPGEAVHVDLPDTPRQRPPRVRRVFSS